MLMDLITKKWLIKRVGSSGEVPIIFNGTEEEVKCKVALLEPLNGPLQYDPLEQNSDAEPPTGE